jgi:inhibitor of KinA
VRIEALGDGAITVRFGEAIDPEIYHKVRAFSSLLEERPLPAMVEVVAAYASVTVFYDIGVAAKLARGADLPSPYEWMRGQVEAAVASLSATPSTPSGVTSGARTVDIPVCYGGEFGPDLDEVAGLCGITADEVVALHIGGEYLAYMIGFAPGFPYLGGLPDQLEVPRKAAPRLHVPAGSVGLAGKQTGVYPLASPGGWQIIGRTPIRLFTPERTPPTLLQAGDIVRFRAISREEYKRLAGEPQS